VSRVDTPSTSDTPPVPGAASSARTPPKWLPVAVFVAISFGLSWLIALPLWLGGGLANPFAGLVAVLLMSTPAIAALVVVIFVDRPKSIPRELGIWPLRPAGRLLLYLALAIIVPVALILIALPVGALLGVYQADVTNFSGFQELLAAQMAGIGEAALPIPIGVLVALQFVNVLFGAFINLIPALGEELGSGLAAPKADATGSGSRPAPESSGGCGMRRWCCSATTTRPLPAGSRS